MKGQGLRRLLGDFSVRLNQRLGRYRLNAMRSRHGVAKEPSYLAVLMYHGLEDDATKLAHRPLDVTPKQCQEEIEFYIRQGYQIISPAQLATAEQGVSYLIVSFDDGHSNIATHLQRWMAEKQWPFMLSLCPEIIRSQLPFWWEEAAARFDLASEGFSTQHKLTIEIGGTQEYDFDEFVRAALASTNEQRLMMMEHLREQTSAIAQADIESHPAVHKNLNLEQVKQLAAEPLVTIAAHSMTHEVALSMSDVELRDNAQRCRDFFKSEVNCDVQDYVYPNGLFSAQTDSLLLELGFERLYSIGANIPSEVIARGNISRVRGYGYGAESLRYFAHQWQQRHETGNDASTQSSEPFY